MHSLSFCIRFTAIFSNDEASNRHLRSIAAVDPNKGPIVLLALPENSLKIQQKPKNSAAFLKFFQT